MLQNVFEKTRFVHGIPLLAQRYAPTTVAELCTDETTINEVKQFLQKERHFAVRAVSGCGATSAVHLISSALNFVVSEVSCSQGSAFVCKFLRHASMNVLMSLQCDSRKAMVLVRDIEGLNKTERGQILNVIEGIECHAVVFFNNVFLTQCAWPTISFPLLAFEPKMIHLCWVVAEEDLNVSFERIQELAAFHDLRFAVNSLALNCFSSRDVISGVDDYQTLLFGRETLKAKDDALHSTDILTDLLCDIDILEFRPTKEWFISIGAEYVRQNFDYQMRQSLIARHAQSCHRRRTLRDACNLINILPPDMSIGAYIWGMHCFSEDAHEHLSHLTPEQRQAVYTITKTKLSGTKAKSLRSLMALY